MAIYNVHGGHNFKVPGASGYFSETTEDRNVKNAVISKLRALGHTVYDCTDDDGTTQSQNLVNIVKKCNAHTVDLDISIHFNASNGQGHGTEVLLYGNGTHRTIGQNICNAIAELGFRNRGIKDGSGLYVVTNTKALAILIECCFCDNETDYKLYNADKMATAIVKGITGKSVGDTTSNNSNNKSNPGESAFNRVVEVTADTLNCRNGAGVNNSVVRQFHKGDVLTVRAKKRVDGTYWLKDSAGWVSSKYCKDVVYTCIVSELNRRKEPNLSSSIVGRDTKGYAHLIKQLKYSNSDGITMAQDIAGYWFSTVSKYVTRSLRDINFNK